MKLANLGGRAVLINAADQAVDVHQASAGKFGPDLQPIYEDWDAFRAWAGDTSLEEGVAYDSRELGPPSPNPRQILAIGLNYAEHAAESGFEDPKGLPPVFPKFVSSLTGPITEVTLPKGGNTDWEVELVAIIGRRTEGIEEATAWGAHCRGHRRARPVRARQPT